MNPLILGPILDIGKTLLDRFVPDPEKKREAEMELVRMAADGELKQVIAQLEINAREAAHPSLWVAGWRPYFGWVALPSPMWASSSPSWLGWLRSKDGLRLLTSTPSSCGLWFPVCWVSVGCGHLRRRRV